MSKKFPRVAYGALTLLLLTVAPPVAPAASASSPDDPAVFALIDTLRPIGTGLNIDGDCSDWGAIPVFADPVADAGPDASKDIIGVAIAPLDDALVVRIDSAAAPPATAEDYWLQVDFRNQQYWDLTFSLASTFAFLDALPEAGETGSGRFAWTSAHQIAVGTHCIEVRIPYASLETQLPPVMQGQLSGASARSWLRVRVTTGEPLDYFDTEIDYGPAIGSFRLVATPFDLDPPLPSSPSNPFETRFPLIGEWYLGQGTHGVGTHQFIPWGYDWHKVDGSLKPEEPERSSILSDNYSYGEAIIAPQAGIAGLGIVNDQPDCTPYAACPGGAGINNMFLEVAGDIGILFSHTQPSSIPFAAGQSISSGSQIASVGNSGSGFSWPHLHHEVRDRSMIGDPSMPLFMTDVEAGLNPGLDGDPWKRKFSTWQPREGFFVRPIASAAPSMSIWGGTLLVVTLLSVGLLRRSRRPDRP